MANDVIKTQFLQAQTLLAEFSENPENFERIAKAGKLMAEVLQNNGKIISCGNGGSMSDAMHFAEELSGKFRNDRPGLAAVAISDPAHITCTANDFGFDQVFSRYIEAIGKPGDILLAISTSGNSQNIINAVRAAHCKGMKVVGLTGKDGGKIGPLCDIEIRVPWNEYSDRIQEIHIMIIHNIILTIEKELYL
ncbi:MAG: D-sedoheptulose 7-phosphate isomerase [Bacteroidales bacterium]|nr:D-sedoheptulose 7-phosphate isomerase [Bacteroidales bacterium]HOY38136.1 D-sedoheptulose 7-phosphate isomerase [Bacteroidales bacterium]HQP03034.1 D-sedoheptulose 7-phosphate isomerase [Bacteroidales bacterium]